jgi:hypothetical protein
VLESKSKGEMPKVVKIDVLLAAVSASRAFKTYEILNRSRSFGV